MSFLSSSVLGSQRAELDVRGLRRDAVTLSLLTPLGTRINISAPIPSTRTASAPALAVALTGAKQVLSQCKGATSSAGCDLQGTATLDFKYGHESEWNVSFGANSSLVICGRGQQGAAAKVPRVPLALVSSSAALRFVGGESSPVWPELTVRVP